MKQSISSVGVKCCGGMVLLLLSLSVGCAGDDERHPTTLQYEATPTSKVDELDRCEIPNEGCDCATPGEVVDCGKVIVKVDNYETCYVGSRICSHEATWGPCVSDQVIAQSMK